MRTIEVRLGQNNYSINIGSGILSQTGQMLQELGLSNKAVIITNPVVKKLYGILLQQSLTESGFKTVILEIPDGEEYKSLESAGELYHQLMDFGAERTTTILALGGGVIGDLAGFVAATYMRGVPLVQLPTTLLSQCDSSIGGKTAVNHGHLKNEIGAFYQPKMTVTDIATLKTLPQAELTGGLAEVVKYAVIKDELFLTYLENHLDKIKALDKDALETIVVKSAMIKAEIVSRDEKDMGIRNILNFGHTVGHAVEAVTNFQVSHGQAVSIGMAAAAKIAVELDIMSANHLIRLIKILTEMGLKTSLPQVEVKDIMQAMQFDKKVLHGKIRLILPRSIGQVFITDDVNPGVVEKVLREMK
jgi:3-dehydroquinate synthase